MGINLVLVYSNLAVKADYDGFANGNKAKEDRMSKIIRRDDVIVDGCCQCVYCSPDDISDMNEAWLCFHPDHPGGPEEPVDVTAEVLKMFTVNKDCPLEDYDEPECKSCRLDA